MSTLVVLLVHFPSLHLAIDDFGQVRRLESQFCMASEALRHPDGTIVIVIRQTTAQVC